MNNLKILIPLGIILIAVVLISAFDIPSLIKSTSACPCSYEEDEGGNRKALEIFYPQICQLTIPDLEKTDKEDEVFDACWELKIIYDAVPHQINALQKMIELTQDPEKGCNLDRCDPQCVDATCYAKDFHCSGGCPLCNCPGDDCSVASADCDCADCPACECQPECVGHCSKHQTSYSGESLPCKSDIIDFYSSNGAFRVCPDLHAGNSLVNKYYLQIEAAEKKIQKTLCSCQKKNAGKVQKRAKEIKEKSELLKDLSQELEELTDECLCSKKSLCEVTGCDCEEKGCCPLSQCSEEQIKEINKKIGEIEEAIKELIRTCEDEYEHKSDLREYIK